MDVDKRHPATEHLAELLEPNPNLPGPLREVADLAARFRDKVLNLVGDGPETTTGLRKLLEAKDCFVRQALLDQQSSPSQ